MRNPYKDIAGMIQAQAAGQAAQALQGVPLELGTITASGLKLDAFKHEIRDYLVADWTVRLHLPEFTIKGSQVGLKDSFGEPVTGDAVWTFEPAVIDSVRINVKAGLKPGDRVLVAPIHGGQDYVVIAKVVS